MPALTVVLDATAMAREVLAETRRIQTALLDRFGEAVAGGETDNAVALDQTCTHLALAASAARRLVDEPARDFDDGALEAVLEALGAVADAFDADLPAAEVNAALDTLTDRLDALVEGEAPARSRQGSGAPRIDDEVFADDDFLGEADGGDMVEPAGDADGGSPGFDGFDQGVPARPPRSDWKRAAKPAVDDKPDALLQTIFLGTDRAPDARAKGGFGKGRGPRLTLAEVEISVPTARKRGALPRPGRFLLWDRREDPDKHIVIAGGPTVLDEAAFLSRVKSEQGDGAGFLFVHGYNSPFANGLYRTAQLAVDLEVSGPVFHYSWPSAGHPVFYDYDDVSADRAQVFLQEFFELTVDKAGIRRLNVIAHSKGNDLMLQTLLLMAQGRQTLVKGELVLASPDVDADQAGQFIPKLARLFSGVTLYANEHDRPLLASKVKASGPRAGGLMKDGAPLIVQGADSIDAGDQDFAWFGLNHDAYVAAPALRNDIKALFEHGTRPVHLRTPSFLLRDTPRTPFWRPDED